MSDEPLKWTTEVVTLTNGQGAVRLKIEKGHRHIEEIIPPRDVVLFAMHLTSASVAALDITEGRK